jgi:phenylalanyl-tRNA synthetase beta chain
LAEFASARATQLLIDLADAKYVGTSQAGLPIKNRKVKISRTQISKYLGFPYTAKQVAFEIESPVKRAPHPKIVCHPIRENNLLDFLTI